MLFQEVEMIKKLVDDITPPNQKAGNVGEPVSQAAATLDQKMNKFKDLKLRLV